MSNKPVKRWLSLYKGASLFLVGAFRSLKTNVPSETTASMDESDDNLSEAHGSALDDLHLTIWDFFLLTATRYPDRDAVVSLWQHDASSDETGSATPHDKSTSASQCLRWTYHDLVTRVHRVAAALEQRNCKPGMQIAVVLWNCAEWALLWWVAAKLRLTFVPIDPRNAADARAMLSCIEPRIVVVQDRQGAAIVEECADITKEACYFFQCQGYDLTEPWSHLDILLEGGVSPRETILPPDDAPCDQPPALIAFTSGTGGTPKGCAHSQAGVVSQTFAYDPNPDDSTDDRWLVHTPVSHVFALNNASRAFRMGGTVVFAAKTFDVESTLTALTQEQCTIMSATPTLVKVLLAHPRFPDVSKLNLSLVTLAGTIITEDDVALCKKALGAQDAIQAYGMTEGAPIISWQRGDPLLKDGYHAGIGKVLPGASIRICDPESCQVLQRGTIGELHIGGTSVISGYLQGVNSDRFHRDSAGHWLATGDQAKMDKDGVVYLLGRYKDLIIRGGHNIDPTKIEKALSVFPELQAQVVGVADRIAGQLPVAVVTQLETVSSKQVIDTVAQMGTEYMLKSVVTLAQLGLEQLPVTSLGKVKKQVLRIRLAEHVEKEAKEAARQQHLSVQSQEDVLIEQLIGAWEAITGARPNPDDAISSFADSITLLRYCDGVFRACGQKLYLPDIVSWQTIREQARLLRQRISGSNLLSLRPLGILADSSVTDPADEDYFVPLHAVKDEQHDTPASALSRLGLPSNLIESVVEIRRALDRTVHGQRPQAYHIRMVFRVREVGLPRILDGIAASLELHPMLRSVLLRNQSGRLQHVTVQASPMLNKLIIHEVEVADEAEARILWEDGSASDHTSALMFQCKVITARDSGQHWLSMTFSHSVVDAMSLLEWHRDLDKLLSEADVALPERTCYTFFADMYFQYEESRLAQASVQHQVRRLRGISRSKASLWPKQQAPGWMMSDDDGFPMVSERRKVRETVWEGRWDAQETAFHFPRRGRVVRLSNLQKLREKHGIHPALLTLSALVLFNASRTKTQRAIFSTWESGRIWPFAPAWLEQVLPPAMSVNGPTVAWVLQMFEIYREETVLVFLKRMAREQEGVKRHQHAPWQKVLEELREEGQVAMDASYRQAFVWDMSLALIASQSFREELKVLEPVNRYDWPDSGVFWNAFMISEDSLFFLASWDTAQLNEVEVDECCDLLADAIRRLDDEENWDKTLSELF